MPHNTWHHGVVLKELKQGQQIKIESHNGGSFTCQNKGFEIGDLVSFKLNAKKQIITILPKETAKLKELLKNNKILQTSIEEEKNGRNFSGAKSTYLSERHIDEENPHPNRKKYGSKVQRGYFNKQEFDPRGNSNRDGGGWDNHIPRAGQTPNHNNGV